jgi:hypothetical protein
MGKAKRNRIAMEQQREANRLANSVGHLAMLPSPYAGSVIIFAALGADPVAARTALDRRIEAAVATGTGDAEGREAYAREREHATLVNQTMQAGLLAMKEAQLAKVLATDADAAEGKDGEDEPGILAALRGIETLPDDVRRKAREYERGVIRHVLQTGWRDYVTGALLVEPSEAEQLAAIIDDTPDPTARAEEALARITAAIDKAKEAVAAGEEAVPLAIVGEDPEAKRESDLLDILSAATFVEPDDLQDAAFGEFGDSDLAEMIANAWEDAIGRKREAMALGEALRAANAIEVGEGSGAG